MTNPERDRSDSVTPTRDEFNELSQNTRATPEGEYRITPGMPELLRQAAAEGLVLLENDGVLPLDTHRMVSVFGRCQVDYFYVGYGSGGDVIPPYTTNLIDSLRESGLVRLDETTAKLYRDWCEQDENRPDEGYWGNWPMHYEEMPLSEDLVSRAAAESDVAIVVIGRAAGEDRESLLEKGSYYLTDDETTMLDLVTAAFDQVVVILDCGNIMDLAWTETYGEKISALIYAWQGGMESGRALVDALTGIVNFSGHLSDSIARHYADYASSRSFGNEIYNNYVEDIYVGYRYFETFAPDQVLYPFGYGLSYTSFTYDLLSFERRTDRVSVRVRVKNTGRRAGHGVAQLYMGAPQGKLGKPHKALVAFRKTVLLEAGESEELNFEIQDMEMASYDDAGKAGHPSSYILESGLYRFYLGADVRSAEPVASFNQAETIELATHDPVMAIAEGFGRMVPGELADLHYELNWEAIPVVGVDLKRRILERLPVEIEPEALRKAISFARVIEDPSLLDTFISQLTDEELEALTRGEGGMNSALGTEGNAGAFGGIIPSLRERGVAPIITTDGPAGIRLRRYCSLLPCGTALASSWNLDLVERIHDLLGEEMVYYGTDVLLGPGMNIHRNPLCGRNFEYFSEDPLLTGKMAAAVVRGIQRSGVAACPKHFALNNQESNRNYNDSRASERAIREIYLKGFEIVVKEAAPELMMTSYNKINGVWAHYNYDLATTVLRGEWGFDGMLVTDWWMRRAVSPEFPKLRDNAYRVRAGVDVFMPGGRSFDETDYVSDGTLLESLGDSDGITRAELQQTARRVLRHVIRRESKR